MTNLNLQSYGIYETHMRNILNEIEKKGDGDFFKVDIKSTPISKMKAKFRNQYLVEKYTTICVRKGVNYKKIKAVKHRNFERMWLGVELPKSKQTTKYPIPSYEKLLLQDEKTNKIYIKLYPQVNSHPKVQYFLNGCPVTKENLKNLGIMQDSYWNSYEGSGVMITPELCNIVKVYKKGE